MARLYFLGFQPLPTCMAIYLYAFEFGLNFEELCQALPFKYLKWNLFIIGLVLEDTLPQAIFFH